MAGRIVSASIRAVVGTKKPIKAALTLVSMRSIKLILLFQTKMYYIFFQTPSAVDQLKKILSGKSNCVSYAFIVYVYVYCYYFFYFQFIKIL